jgi:ssDNA-binding Zn-finger/Zn-ribbon topoisomerase 1
MEWVLVIGLLIICFIVVVLRKDTEVTKDNEIEKLPYKVSDSLLTDAEASFYHSLRLYVGDRAVICPKVGLKDIFFIGKGAGKDYMRYYGKISQKHVDFLLCDPVSMKPLCGVELDDISHTQKKRQERDLFVKKVYREANLKLIRVSAKSGYTQTEIETALTGVFNTPIETLENQSSDNTILCPKCDIPMVLRRASRGKNAGREFYGCPNYPKCKEIINIEA